MRAKPSVEPIGTSCPRAIKAVNFNVAMSGLPPRPCTVINQSDVLRQPDAWKVSFASCSHCNFVEAYCDIGEGVSASGLNRPLATSPYTLEEDENMP